MEWQWETEGLIVGGRWSNNGRLREGERGEERDEGIETGREQDRER